MLFELALILVDGIGPVTARTLISTFGSAEAVFREKATTLHSIPGVSTTAARSLRKGDTMLRAEKEYNFILQHDIRPLLFSDPDYPQRLKFCDDGPVILFSKGNASLNQDRMIAVVGTRGVGEYGASVCREIVEQLTPYQPVIVSGLALGVDTIAHKLALDNGLQTIAALGHGLDRIYPAENRKLSQRICEQGMLVTEIFSDNLPDRENFPKRNRIVAGMTQATIVIESAIKGGSMITANLAFDYSRDVFAVPGRITDKSFTGCNRLIATNRAAMFTSVEDFVLQMGWEQKANRTVQQNLFPQLSADEEILVNYLKSRDPIQMDNMSMDLKIPISKLNSDLMGLELKGIVKAFPGKKFALLSF